MNFLFRRAIQTSRRDQLAVRDALIIEAARSGGCDRVLSENLGDGRDYDGVLLKNPFVPADR